MKVILSRKGFDSAAGGVASPIFDDGTMISLPIPSKHAPIRYDQITYGGHDIGRVVADLTGRAIRGSATAHLDPDLVATALRTRGRGWRGLFGQAHNAQQVLAGAGVGPGDLFLFFGWFRRATQHDGTYHYAKASKNIHALWGWMPLIDWLNLGIHELGHPLTAMVWRRIEPYGGTIFQLLFPAAIALHFHLRGEPASAAGCQVWLGESLLNVARYMDDATLKQLPLVGGGNHDWATIFGRWGVLHLDGVIANITRLAALAVMLYTLWWMHEVRRRAIEEA